MIKKVSILVMICVLAIGSVNVQAAKYAYSIGTNWGTTGELTGDYRINANNAMACYGEIANVVSCIYIMPSGTDIRSNNPNGKRIIASKVVFLNGHAAAKRILFNHLYDPACMTGVCAGIDKEDNGYTFAGLSSTDMSSCNLITFAGCETAYVDANDYNLIEKAIARGANTAVGFRGAISSTSPSGQDWLCAYNIGLAEGKTVSQSINKAVTTKPNDLMSSLVQIAGDPTKSFNTSVLSLAAELVSEYEDSPTLNILDGVEIDAQDFNQPYIKSQIKEIDPSINWDNYRVNANMYSPEYGYGCVVFYYVIDGQIDTNKAYVCSIENNKLVDITYTLDDTSTVTSMEEELMIDKVEDHEANKEVKTTTARLVNLNDYKENYFYDYKTDKLYYKEFIAVNHPELDVIIPECEETEL